MTTTFTTSSTSSFTITHAKYLASKIAADLRQMQIFYGRPTDKEIEDYIVEAAVLLVGEYLKDVTYGFRRNGEWVMALKYEVRTGGVLIDDRSGRIRPGINVSTATWGSFLNYSAKYNTLSSSDRERVHALLPFPRSYGEEPRASVRTFDKSYSNGGVSLQRQMFTPN